MVKNTSTIKTQFNKFWWVFFKIWCFIDHNGM